MKLQIKRATALACTLLLLAFIPNFARGADSDYSFKVHNNTKNTIKKLLASEDGETYGFFDIGKGIKAGESMTLVWAKNEGKCKQWFKAVYDDDSESAPVQFDFCEKNLELEFS